MPLHHLRPTVLLGVLLFLISSLAPTAAYGQVQDTADARAQADILTARADSLKEERAVDEARLAYEKALSLYREVDAEVEVAAVVGELGALQYLTGNVDSALGRFESALAKAKEAGAKAEVANNLNNIGLIHWRRGRYDEAIHHIREAISVHRTRGDSAQVAEGLNNLANIQEERGHYRAARKNLEEAVEMNRRTEDQASLANNLTNLAVILKGQGRLEAALQRNKEALRIHRSLDHQRESAAVLNNMGLILRMKGQYQAAIRRYEESIEINRSLDRTDQVVSTLSNLGAIRREQGRYPEAMGYHRKALRLHRKRDEPASVATDLDNIGQVYAAQGKYDAALKVLREALSINRELERRHAVATNLENVGNVYLDRRAYSVADSVFAEAVQVTDTLLQTASGDDRRDFLAKEVSRFHALVTTRVRAGRIDEAIRAYERSRARLLAERLAGGADSSRTIPPVDSLQSTMDAGEAAVLYANTDTERPILAIIVTRKSTFAEEIPDDSTLDRLRDRFDGALDRLRVREEIRWSSTPGSKVLRQAKGLPMGAEAEGTLTNLVRLYHYNVSVPSQWQVLSPERTELLGRFLYDLLVGPLEEELASANELVIVPDGALSYLPFGALSSWDGRRLVQRWPVRYVQSLRVHRLLQERDTTDPADDRLSLLAVGGAVYDSESYAADTSGVGDLDALQRRPDSRRESIGLRTYDRGRGVLQSGVDDTPAAIYRRLGYGRGNWTNLTGTLREVRALSDIADGSGLLVGEEAREGVIHEMSRTGRLDDYRALHFATHGFVVPEEPKLSALVMSEVGLSETTLTEISNERPRAEGNTAEDGYLSMEEIAALDIDTEFVALSACQTGIGRIYRGSGAVSLAHGFLRAGASSVAVSLWSVYDSSTSRFMEAVYRRAWDQETSWSEAIARTKRAFANGKYGERLQAPRFWAPFVYYGSDAGERVR